MRSSCRGSLPGRWCNSRADFAQAPEFAAFRRREQRLRLSTSAAVGLRMPRVTSRCARPAGPSPGTRFRRTGGRLPPRLVPDILHLLARALFVRGLGEVDVIDIAARAIRHDAHELRQGAAGFQQVVDAVREDREIIRRGAGHAADIVQRVVGEQRERAALQRFHGQDGDFRIDRVWFDRVLAGARRVHLYFIAGVAEGFSGMAPSFRCQRRLNLVGWNEPQPMRAGTRFCHARVIPSAMRFVTRSV